MFKKIFKINLHLKLIRKGIAEADYTYLGVEIFRFLSSLVSECIHYSVLARVYVTIYFSGDLDANKSRRSRFTGPN